MLQILVSYHQNILYCILYELYVFYSLFFITHTYINQINFYINFFIKGILLFCSYASSFSYMFYRMFNVVFYVFIFVGFFYLIVNICASAMPINTINSIKICIIYREIS